MNDLVKQLVQKAKIGGGEFGNGVNYYVATEEAFDDFAKLIIYECSELVQSRLDPYNAWITPADIKDHFGIE
jgi:hypothetical protein